MPSDISSSPGRMCNPIVIQSLISSRAHITMSAKQSTACISPFGWCIYFNQHSQTSCCHCLGNRKGIKCILAYCNSSCILNLIFHQNDYVSDWRLESQVKHSALAKEPLVLDDIKEDLSRQRCNATQDKKNIHTTYETHNIYKLNISFWKRLLCCNIRVSDIFVRSWTSVCLTSVSDST